MQESRSHLSRARDFSLVTTGSRLAIVGPCGRIVRYKTSIIITETITIAPFKIKCLVACLLIPERARLRPCPRRELTSTTVFLNIFFFPDIAALLSTSYAIGLRANEALRLASLLNVGNGFNGGRVLSPLGPSREHVIRQATPHSLHPSAAQG